MTIVQSFRLVYFIFKFVRNKIAINRAVELVIILPALGLIIAKLLEFIVEADRIKFQ